MKLNIISLLCLAVSALFTLPANAGIEHTWTGGGTSANWNDAANWNNGLPSNGDNLVFTGTTRQINTNNLLASVGNVTFNEGGFAIYGYGAGTNLALNGNIGNTGNNNWAINLSVSGSRTIESYAGILDGTFTVSGNIILGPAGSVILNANHTTGNNGYLTVSGVISGGAGASVSVTKGGSGDGAVTLTGTIHTSVKQL